MTSKTAGLVGLSLALLIVHGCGPSVDPKWAALGPDDDAPATEQDTQLAALRRKVEASPGSVPARRALADGLFLRGRLVEALPLWAELLRGDPSNEGLASALLDAVRLFGAPETAVQAHCQKILSADKENQGALWVLGELFLSQNQMRQARQFLTSAWRADPTYWPAAIALARVGGFQLQGGEARTWCTRAEQAAPRTFEAQAELAMAYLQAGDLQKALDLAGRAQALGPQQPLPYTIRAKALLGAGRPREAVAAARRAVELGPDPARVADPGLAAAFARLRAARHWRLGEA